MRRWVITEAPQSGCFLGRMEVGCLPRGAHDDEDNDNNNRTYCVAIVCAEKEGGGDHPLKRENPTLQK